MDKPGDGNSSVFTEQEFTHSAGRQLALFACYALLAIAVLLYLLSLAARSTGSNGVASGAIDIVNNSISITLQDEPPQLDASRASDAVSGTVLFHVMEGLLSYGPSGELVPGVAQRWELRADGATFWLRENARWSDGEPVTAHDFVFSWRRAVDPATASDYSFILYSVKNAELVNSGELPLSYLGVNARDDYTLEVEFERPTPFFDKLVAFATYYPMREDFLNSTNGRYGADADMMLYNGPYMITSWVHNASMRWEKNPFYWNENRGFLDAINVDYMTSDVNAKLNLFKDRQIADTTLSAPMLPSAMEQRWHIDRFMEGTVFFLELNHRAERLTGNYHFRKALQLAQDPAELVYRALKEASYLPAPSLFPEFIRGVDDLFRKEYPPEPHRMDVAAAREHLEMARQELGLQEFPPLVLLTGDSPISMVAAEYYQALYRKNLGLEIRIDAQIFKQRLAKMDVGDFDIVLAGWGPDYDDALTFGDLFTSWNLNNHGRYNNPQMDELVRTAQESLDPRIRMEAFAGIQQMVKDDVVIIPMYERGYAFVADPRLKGFERRSIGTEMDYSYAYIDVPDE